MPKRAEVVLSDEDRQVLERWARRPKSSQALALRCRIVLAAAAGELSQDIAARLGCNDSTVGKWLNTMDDSPDVALLHRAWEAMTQGDLAVLKDALAADAKWHGTQDGQLCDGREAILEVIGRNLPGRLRGKLEETIQTRPARDRRVPSRATVRRGGSAAR